jgi:hypothetical protein
MIVIERRITLTHATPPERNETIVISNQDGGNRKNELHLTIRDAQNLRRELDRVLDIGDTR